MYRGTLGHPGGPLGPLGPTPRDRHLVEATERRLEFGGGAAIPERGYWVGGMRVSVFGLYFELEKRPAGAFWADKIVF